MDVNAQKNRSTVIVVGVDTPIGVAILRDLGRHHYFNVGIGRYASAIGFASRHCHRSEVRASTEGDFIAQLLQLAHEYGDVFLIAVSENDNLIINRHRQRLEQLMTVLAPSQLMLEKVLDKNRCLGIAQSVGIRIPESFQPESFDQVLAYSQQPLDYPRVLKWADPNEVAQALSQAGLACEKCQYVFDAEDLVAKLEPYQAIDRFPMIQEYCAGHGVGQMFLVQDGEVKLAFQHERLHEWPPEGGVSTLCKSLTLEHHRQCRESSMRLLKQLQWTGVAMVEYRYDPAKAEYYFMEINGRFWGSLPLAIAAGVPFASGWVALSQGRNLQQPRYPQLHCRYMIPETRRLLRLLFQAKAVQDPCFRVRSLQELVEYFRGFLRRGTHYYLYSRQDPGPFWADMRNIMGKMTNRFR